MAQDYGLIMRIAACAATEGVPGNPSSWADDRWQKLVASPGWDAAWASAVTGGIEDPGEDEAVITDGQILSAVQLLIAAELAATPPPDPAE